ncbi:hypothetical protein INH39_06070 [Massilia violaceinigra]|uniref:Uncharacterized protein n=1 Tax=Massilia violaceinigra TaxID=2045208 RepID=A0ABY4A8Z7_9BURK|nr:hypothetical protein [Massilia violaceinigra]UOD31279.1 hypothetical protein INH39_06070 [Massilia violaceinigra]
MTIFINESGMAFGPYEVRHCFYMEKSRLYLGLGPGVQIAEFALLRNGKHGQAVWLIEAKSSSPRPGTLRDFDRFIAEITQKMSNSVQLLMAAILERHPDTGDLSADFKAIALKSIGFKCVLVINGHKDAWLAPLQDALVKAMRPLCKSLRLGAQAVAVMNETTASQTGLITV